MKVVRREFASVPQIAALNAKSSGLIDEAITELRPVFRDYQERVRLLYRPRMIGILADGLTPSEASDVAEFYRSDLGRRVMGLASRNYSPDATIGGIAQLTESEEFEAAQEDIEMDLRAATNAVMKEMRDEDFSAVARLMQEKPALLKLNAINPKILEMRTQMENEQPNEQELARIDSTIERVFSKRLGN
ncbi:MAG: DUF2059 domain-containing protein [Pseudomonadota bacterium]